MPPNNKQPETRLFVNQHEMISNPEWLYDGIVGGKAGWTTAAGYTLVTAAERDGKTLIAVVMKSPRNDDKYTDTKALLDWGFSEFDKIEVTEEDLPSEEGYSFAGHTHHILVPKGIKHSDVKISTIMENGVDYAVVTDVSGKELARIPCEVAIDVTAKTAVEIRSEQTYSFLMFILYAILAVVGAFVLFCLSVIIRKQIYRARKRRRKRRQRRRR